MQMQYDEFTQFALKLARAAAKPIMRHYKQVSVDYKADGSEVTAADREAEAAVRTLIADSYPDHAILGEEFDDQGPGDAEYQWVIDPLDGTRWFALGVPLFGTLIALMRNGEPVVGVIHLPVSGEFTYASTGGGCWHQMGTKAPARVKVSKQNVSDLHSATLSASGTHASDIEPVADRPVAGLSQVIQSAGTFRFCGDCLQHALVAQGVIHGAIDTIMAPWDIAAIVPCIREAGGVVSNIHGDTNNLIYGGSLVSAANPAIHRNILSTLIGPAQS